MEDGNLAILVDAKTEYTNQLVNIISPNIYLGIKKIYIESKETCNNNNDDDVLCQFQKDLSEIPKWNQEVINAECDLLIENSKCDWLDDLLTAVFVSHTRILTSINFNKNKNKINLKIPKVDHFIHLCFIEIARHFWKNPYLFDDSISKFEYQRNRRDAEKIIDNTINETIRKQLPVKHILKEYLGTEFKDTKLEDETINESADNENLRKMVKAEIENCSKEKLKRLNISSDINMDVMEDDSLLDLNDEFKLEKSKQDVKLSEITPSKEDIKSKQEVKLSEITPSKEYGTPSEVDLNISNKENIINIKSSDTDINDLIDNEVNNLKIETLNLDFDDLQNLEEIYIDEPKIDKIDINDNKNKIKTVYIETDENKDDKVKKHSKNDFNFF